MSKINLSRKRLEDYVDITEFNSDNEKIEDHTSKSATGNVSGHVKLSDTADADRGQNSGIAVTPKALHDATSGVTEKVDKLSEDYAEHEKLEGTYQVAGHVKLSNAVNSQSSVSDGVAATPRAVKEVNDGLLSHEGLAATNDKLGHVKIGEGINVDEDGTISVDEVDVDLSVFEDHMKKKATKDIAGHVTLSDNYLDSISGENDGVALTPSAGFKLFNQVYSEITTHENKFSGKGTTGHVMLSDEVDDDRDVNRFTAATPKAVKTVNERIDNLDKSDVGLGNVDNTKQATKTEFDKHVDYIGNFGAPGHVRLSNHTTSESSVSHGVAATPLAVKTVNDDLADHKDTKATWGVSGHVTLSDSTNENSNEHSGIAATPRAVKKAYDRANEALTLGNRRKKQLVDSLLSKDSSLPIDDKSDWDDILKQLDGIGVPYVLVELIGKESFDVRGLDFSPDSFITLDRNEGASMRFKETNEGLWYYRFVSGSGEDMEIYKDGFHMPYRRYEVDGYIIALRLGIIEDLGFPLKISER